MLPQTSIALPWPFISRGLRVHVEQDVVDDLLGPRLRLVRTFCIVPQRFLSSALARSVRPLVFASNHWSTLSGEVSSWSISRAS